MVAIQHCAPGTGGILASRVGRGPKHDGLRSADSLRHGDHVCAAFASPSEQQELLIDFVQGGLEAGDRIWYLAEPGEATWLLGLLHQAGLPIDAPLARGQLLVSDRSRIGAGTNSAAMLHALESVVGDALASGYGGVRFAGQMHNCRGGEPDSASLVRWEEMLSEFCEREPATGLCEYDRRQFDPRQLEMLLDLHPAAVRLARVSPDGLLRITEVNAEGNHLRLAGEADISNSQLLAELLAKAAAVGGDVHIHAHGLEFIDASGLGALVRTAAEIAPHRRFVVHDPCRSLVRLLELLPACRELLEVSVGGGRNPARRL